LCQINSLQIPLSQVNSLRIPSCQANNLQYFFLKRVIPRVSGQNHILYSALLSHINSKHAFSFSLSSYSYQCNNTPPFSPAKLHYPLAESDPFLNKSRYPIGIYRPSQHVFVVLHSYCITSIHSILCQKWCTLYLSLFDQSNQRFHLQISRRRNLNRGICHTPIFALRHH